MKMLPFMLCLACTMWSCRPSPQASEEEMMEKARQEILQAEKDFAAMAEQEGVPAAFLAFAADSAALNRNNRIIKGKAAIRAYFEQSTLQDVSLKWSPEFVETASSGDMGYTYGPFRFSAVDTAGQQIQAEGVFHTVWKKQPNGEWKFVYD